MKKLLTFSVALVLSMSFFLVEAQPHRSNQSKHKKEYYKKQNKRHKDRVKYNEKDRKAARKYYEKREKEYAKYIKKKNKKYRDHDSWYYAPKFYNRSEYVYFPKYKTYYDPFRRAYVYKNKNKWVSVPTMPSFMVGLNIGGLQMQFIKDLPVRF